MKSLVIYEIKKIITRKITIISSIILFFIISSNIFSVANGDYYLDYTGVESIKKRTDDEQKLQGVLTPEYFSNILSKYNKLKDDPNNLVDPKDKNSGLNDTSYFRDWDSYQPIDMLVDTAFTPVSELGFNKINGLSIKDIKCIYNVRLSNINAYINDTNKIKISDNNKDIIMKKAKSLQTPLEYKTYRGWTKIISNIDDASGMFIMIVLAICISPLFTSEYQTGVDNIILSTKKGKKDIIYSKFIATFLFTTVFYFGFVAYITICNASIYSLSGWNLPIQVSSVYWYSVYNINFLQSYIITVLLGYLANLFSVTVTMMLSSRLKTSFATIILSLVSIFIPYIVYLSSMSTYVNYIFDLFPVNITHLVKIFNSYLYYNILGLQISQPVFMVVVSIVCIGALLHITFKIFKNHEVK